ncbi:MAG: SufD family Fe-S cluster assembly protein, partial [Bacteroidota bacterium]
MVITEVLDKNIARFKTLFDHFEQQLNGQRKHPIHAIRKAAATHLETLRFPTRRDEDYKYTSFARVLNQDYSFPSKVALDTSKIQSLQLEGQDAYLLIFVNGVLDESRSHLVDLEAGLSIQTISNALKDEKVGAFVEEKLTANAKSDNPFLVMNTAFAEGGVFIHVAKNAVIEKPIHFIQYNTTTEQAFIYHPQRLIKVEQGAEVSFIDSHHGENGSTYFSNVVNIFEVGANTQVKHFKLQTESEEAFQVNNTVAYQAKDSTYTNLALDLGGRIVRNNLSTIHQGQNVTSNLYGALLIDGDQHVDNQTFIDHAMPHCQSNELYKAVLDGKSTGVFNGKV